jgi:hypothetical protein
VKARPERSTGADPQGAVARAEPFGADHYDPLAAAVAEARLVERARVVKWLLERTACKLCLRAVADAIDAGEHLDA